ncbi:unnamed protein product [Rotaria magnacalcarata]
MINVNTCSVKFIPNSRCWTKQDDHQDELMNYFITTTGEQDLLISPNIYLHIQKGDTPNTKDHVLAHQFIGILHYKITLYSYKLTLKQLKAIVTEWAVTYRNYIKNKNKGNFYHFTYIQMFTPLSQKPRVEFNRHLFSTSKSFDNLFFEGKQALIDRVNFFLDNPSFYQQRGIAHSLGLLFYEAPGCGKTSMIKAIASYAKRRLVEIPLSRIRTCDELRQAFFLDSYDKSDLDFNNKIIVFEDIDCMSHIIRKRSTTVISDPVISAEGDDDVVIHLEQIDIDARKKKMSKRSLHTILGDDKNVPKDPLTLSFLLNLIDGIIEQPSRMLIMTTNHPEQIDPALLRPGRINIKQEFKRCPKPIIKDIIEFFFNQEKSQLDVSQLHDYTYSPADVVSACMSASNGKSTVQLLAEQALSNVVVEAEKTLACNEQ